MALIHLDPSTSTVPPVGLWPRLRRAIAAIRLAPERDDPLGWNQCGCINALRDTCDPPNQRDAQYRAAFRHAVTKP